MILRLSFVIILQDAAGQRFGYDGENHQTQFFAAGNGSGMPDATYHYDGDGKRVKKVSPTETTVFVYSGGGQIIAEYSTQTAQNPQLSYLTTDNLGSPRIITDQLGAVKDRKDFGAFGDETVTAQRVSSLGYSVGEPTRKGYTGYEKDAESSLEFAQARYYSTTHGRYTSVDPLTASVNIRNPQTFNRYTYVLNSPYKYTDPLGLLPASANSWGGCSAEFSSCGGESGGFASEFERQYQQRLENDYARIRAQAAANRGDWGTFWDIMRSNDTLSAYNENGNRLLDPNEPTVTVEATVQTPVAIVAFGQPGTGDNDVGDNFRRAAAQTQANLEANGWRVINVGEISSLNGFQNVLDTAAKEGAASIYIFSHGAGGAIDLGDGARNDTKDVTLSNVTSLRNNGTVATLFIRACYTGYSDRGVAAALSSQLRIPVEAPTTGMSFSPYPDRLSTNKVHPSTGPTYMHAEGRGRLVVCTNGVCR